MASNSFPYFLEKISRWFSRQQVTEVIEDFAPLPAGILADLREKVDKLPSPQPYQTAIGEAFTDALQAWKANPETTPNSIVVLSRSVEAIAPILKSVFQTDMPECDVHLVLGGYQRPVDPLDIPAHLRRELEPQKNTDQPTPTAPVTETDLKNNRPTVMVIPSLEPCFLRCIQGWEGIDSLQTFATQDASRFWVFGCNHWAWAFLERVCQVGAYLEQVVPLPELTGEDLQTWLAPVLEQNSLETPMTDGTPLTLKLAGDAHWSTLASLAEGGASTAARVWLQSLNVKAQDLTDQGAIAADTSTLQIWQTRPSLPSLMTLEVMDRYLLHSLLIHGELTRSHLALSLGEAERNIRSRVQVLRREGILQQQGRRLSVHPAHYPKLYSELGNNNFLIGEA